MADADPVLAHWQFVAHRDGESAVMPDGCRDLILHVDGSGRPRWFVSELASGVEWVPALRDERFVGWRLHPAAQIDQTRLLALLAIRPETEPAQAPALLRDLAPVDLRLAEMLRGLAAMPSVGHAARHLGVHERSLERWVGRGTGQHPGYWLGLARARRAAQRIHAALPLAELALEQGYADQAHMNREFRRWFGLPPGALRRAPELQQTLREPGFS